MKNVFICLIQNYIIHVYLSNNEQQFWLFRHNFIRDDRRIYNSRLGILGRKTGHSSRFRVLQKKVWYAKPRS